MCYSTLECPRGPAGAAGSPQRQHGPVLLEREAGPEALDGASPARSGLALRRPRPHVGRASPLQLSRLDTLRQRTRRPRCLQGRRGQTPVAGGAARGPRDPAKPQAHVVLWKLGSGRMDAVLFTKRPDSGCHGRAHVCSPRVCPRPATAALGKAPPRFALNRTNTHG